MKLAPLLMQFWQEDPFLQAILEMIQPEINRLNHLKAQTLGLASVENATDWVLAAWENAVGEYLTSTKTNSERIEQVRAKLRAGSILTPAALKTLMLAYSGGQVDLVEHISDGYFELFFSDLYTTPTNISDVRAVLDAVKPVQLTYVLFYRYLLIRDVNVMPLTEMEETTLDKMGGGIIYGDDRASATA